MSASEPPSRRFARPWEEPLEPDGPAPPEPVPDFPVSPPPVQPEESPPEETQPEESPPKDGQPEEDEPMLPLAGEEVASLSEEAYLAATTAEFRDLAEEIARASQEEPAAPTAVAAAMPGVGSGLVDFEDVTGQKGISEEETELVEQAAASDLTLRVITAVVLLALFVGTLFLGGWLFTAFVTAVMVVGAGEFYATLRRQGYVPLALFGLLGVVGAAIAAHAGGPGPALTAVVATAVVVVLFFSVVPRRRALDNAAVTVLGTAWIALLTPAIVIGQAPQGTALILLVVLTSGIFDIGAYFVGRAFGRQPLAPVISPKKTWEGLIGGIVAAAGAAALLSTIDWFPVNLSQALVLTLIVIVMAPLGDAAESMIKRALGVKDMGSALPGHGGMLDRVDALVFVVPAAYVLFLTAGLL
jgi:phosphatidate cytidylyltransferase